MSLLRPVLLPGAVIAGVLLLVGGVAQVASSSGTPDAAAQVGVTEFAVGERPSVPDLVGTTLDGASLSTASLRGRVVVLNAWGSWCGPCQDEAPDLASLQRSLRSSDVTMLGLDVKDDAASARTFATGAGWTYPQLQDPDGTLLASLRAVVPPSAVPTTLVLDRSGRVALRVIGPVDAATLGPEVAALAAAPAG